MKRFDNSFDKTERIIDRFEKWETFFLVLAATCMMLGVLFFISGFKMSLHFYIAAGAIVLGVINFFIEVMLNFMSVLIMNLYNISADSKKEEE